MHAGNNRLLASNVLIAAIVHMPLRLPTRQAKQLPTLVTKQRAGRSVLGGALL